MHIFSQFILSECKMRSRLYPDTYFEVFNVMRSEAKSSHPSYLGLPLPSSVNKTHAVKITDEDWCSIPPRHGCLLEGPDCSFNLYLL